MNWDQHIKHKDFFQPTLKKFIKFNKSQSPGGGVSIYVSRSPKDCLCIHHSSHSLTATNFWWCDSNSCRLIVSLWISISQWVIGALSEYICKIAIFCLKMFVVSRKLLDFYTLSQFEKVWEPLIYSRVWWILK